MISYVQYKTPFHVVCSKIFFLGSMQNKVLGILNTVLNFFAISISSFAINCVRKMHIYTSISIQISALYNNGFRGQILLPRMLFKGHIALA